MTDRQKATPHYTILNYQIRQGDGFWMLCLPATYSDHTVPAWLDSLPDDVWLDYAELSKEHGRLVAFGEN